ncbi:hypothetical protein [Pantoea agglomerans]|uniref:hypothetical protein n=1 Tax=Enterobacter agglomerans TaxID=549 RepID=UPI00320AA067
MVNPRDYERYQLDLIKAEYEAKDFIIIDEVKRSSNRMVFDAIAVNLRTREAVIIEIVNANLNGAERPHLRERAEYIRKAIRDREFENEIPHFFDRFMRWSVDFRYIDSKEKSEKDRNIFVQLNFSNESLVKIIGEKLPKPITPPLSQFLLNRQFLSDWSITARTIRSFIPFALSGRNVVEELSVLDLYNIMLSQFDIIPAEQKHEDAILDLFDLFESVQLAINGGDVNPEKVKELRLHLINIRQQIRQWAKHNHRALVIK